MTPRRRGLSTTAIHGAPSRRPDWTPITPSIAQTNAYTNPVGSDEDVLYTGSGNTPSQLALARKYALLEGAEDAIFVGSGTAATALAHLAVLRPGDHLISSMWIYGGTRRFFDEELSRLGIDVTYIDPNHPRLWRRGMRKATRAIFIETPSNPLVRVLDVAAVARAAREQGLALLVDPTFASPVNFRPLEHGADIVITSATKYLNGHGDVVAGAVAGTASLVEEVNRLLRRWGPALDPHAAWLLDRGLRTLGVRMERHNANGQAVAEWAARHPGVARVHYPGLPTHPDHAVARGLLAGFGGMVGLELKGGVRAAERMLRRLKLVAHAPGLASAESLVSEPRHTSHRALDPAARAAAGIPDGFLRLSCGLEDAGDIIQDLEQALGEKA